MYSCRSHNSFNLVKTLALPKIDLLKRFSSKYSSTFLLTAFNVDFQASVPASVSQLQRAVLLLASQSLLTLANYTGK